MENIYMIIGNGSKNQFHSWSSIKTIINKQILHEIPKNATLLYFGDVPNPNKPDIGLVFPYIKQKRSDILIHMIQIKDMEQYGIPDFVSSHYFHKHDKFGGIENGKPISNTREWVKLKDNIKKVFILGGGEITLQEFSLLKEYNIPYKYFKVWRKFIGDSITKIKTDDNLENKIGITYKKCNV